MTYSFHPLAEKELNDAIDYYNDCQDGLGIEFAKEVYKAIQIILQFPRAWSPLSKKHETMYNKPLSLRGNLSR